MGRVDHGMHVSGSGLPILSNAGCLNTIYVVHMILSMVLLTSVDVWRLNASRVSQFRAVVASSMAMVPDQF